MDLEIKQANDELLRRVESMSAEVSRTVASELQAAGINMSRCHFDNASDDPFALDLAFHKCRDLPYEEGISLAVRLQNALRASKVDGWRIRILVQPVSDELVLDYVLWLVVDSVRIAEYLGGRSIEMFKNIESFKGTCWGPSAA